MNCLFYGTFVLVFLSSISFGQNAQSAAEILQTAIKAIEKIDAVEYEIPDVCQGSNIKIKAHTRVIATRSPFRFWARLQAEDASITQLAVSDGIITRASYDNKTTEANTFAPSNPKEKIMPDFGLSSEGVARTWRLLLDADFYRDAIASGNILLAMQDDIDGDRCNVILYVCKSEVFGTLTYYIWISEKSGIPRAVQRLVIARGQTFLSQRFILAKIKVNPIISNDLFTYKPVAADSKVSIPAKSAASTARIVKLLIGRHLPELEVRDMENQPLKLNKLINKPTVLTLWAPWCAFCIKEFAAFQNIQTHYEGKLQIIAIAVQDSRLNVVEFVKKRTEYKFIYLVDPELPAIENSKLFSTLSPEGSTLPVNLLVNEKGIITNYWIGFHEKSDLMNRIKKQMEK
jgi:thiol-disulfide isomerase/thioredoxin